MRRLLAGLALLVVAWPALAAAPSFPALTGRVVDEAGILDAPLEARLTDRLAAHEQATGNQVVVATLRSLQGLTIEDLGNQLYRHWALGRKDKDDGALLLVAPAERKVRIEVGYGLEGELTDAASSTIIQSLILPRFRSNDMAGGVEVGVGGILDLLRPEDGAAQAPGWTKPQPVYQGPSWPMVLAFFVILFFVLAMSRRTGGRRRGGLGYPPLIITSGGFGRGGFGGGSGGGFSGGGGSSGGGGASGSW